MSKRTYTSQLRAASTAATRERILEAAHRCFEERGFAGTTMRAIADQAGASLESVNVVGTKRELLMAAITRATARVETDVRLLDLPEPKAMFSGSDPEAALSNLMQWVGASNQRLSRLWRCLDQAADTDEDIRADYDGLIARMKVETARAVESLGKKGSLRSDMTRSELADLLWLLVLPDQRYRLCIQAGWTQQRYEEWLAWSARQALFAHGKGTL